MRPPPPMLSEAVRDEASMVWSNWANLSFTNKLGNMSGSKPKNSRLFLRKAVWDEATYARRGRPPFADYFCGRPFSKRPFSKRPFSKRPFSTRPYSEAVIVWRTRPKENRGVRVSFVDNRGLRAKVIVRDADEKTETTEAVGVASIRPRQFTANPKEFTDFQAEEEYA